MRIIDTLRSLVINYRFSHCKVLLEDVKTLSNEFEDLEVKLQIKDKNAERLFDSNTKLLKQIEVLETRLKSANTRIKALTDSLDRHKEYSKSLFDSNTRIAELIAYDCPSINSPVKNFDEVKIDVMEMLKDFGLTEWQSLQTAPKDGTHFKLKLSDESVLTARIQVIEIGIEKFSVLQTFDGFHWLSFHKFDSVIGWRPYGKTTNL